MVPEKQRTWAYAAPRPSVGDLLACREQMNRVSAQFLRIDLETALLFVKFARQTGDDFRKKRNCRAARKAYDTIAKLKDKVDFRGDDEPVRRGLERLKMELEGLGETF